MILQARQVGNKGVFFTGHQHVFIDKNGLGEDKPFVARWRLVEQTQQLAVARLGGCQALGPVLGGKKLHANT